MTRLAPETRDWLIGEGFCVQDEALWAEALTHGSTGEMRDYQRLEFLGDRVLGLVIADWLYSRSNAAEGDLAQRLNALVARQMCAEQARALGLAPHIRLGKQARDDGAASSDNVLGDIMEAMLGAQFIEAGFAATKTLIHTIWRSAVEGGAGLAKHPKSALQEWAAGNRRKTPTYTVIDMSGPDHARLYTVEVRIASVGEVRATASGKQEAETKAARMFMERFG